MIQNNTTTRQDEIWTPIAQLTQKIRKVNVRFNVVKKGKTRIVTQTSTGRKHEISDCIVGDSTGIVNLTLWNDDIDAIEQGYTYELRNGFINLPPQSTYLS